MRIGVLADTHIPDRMREMPPRALEVLSTVEIVLHAGDIARVKVLQDLQERLSLTFAVYGESDPPEVKKFLQEMQVLEFGGRRIGLIHGNGPEKKGWRGQLERIWGKREPVGDVHTRIQARLPNVDAIVYGHTHEPFAKTVNGIFMFNPGSPIPGVRGGPSVGLLEITNRGISGKIIYL